MKKSEIFWVGRGAQVANLHLETVFGTSVDVGRSWCVTTRDFEIILSKQRLNQLIRRLFHQKFEDMISMMYFGDDSTCTSTPLFSFAISMRDYYLPKNVVDYLRNQMDDLTLEDQVGLGKL